MVAQMGYNPFTTTTGHGLFAGPSSVGIVQGTAYPDPATRYALRGGILSQSETLCMFGGVGVYEFVPGATGTPSAVLGPVVGRATGLTGSYPLAGFSVFDQNYSAVNTPQSPVPLTGSGGFVSTYRLGSGARIGVACDPNLVDLQGLPISTNVSWDFVNQRLVPYASTTISSAVYATNPTISSGTYATLTGAVSLTTSGAHGLLPGDTFTISALTGTGAAQLDGTWIATMGTAGNTLNFTAPTGLAIVSVTGGTLGTGSVTITTASPHGLLPGDTFELSSLTGTNATTYLAGVTWVAAASTTGSTLRLLITTGLTLTLTAGNVTTGGILPVTVLDVQVGNCMTVVYNTVTNTASWNYNDSAAIIQI
jgi:hypothetical protein